MYGTQAMSEEEILQMRFENDVKMYGTQAQNESQGASHSLRMM